MNSAKLSMKNASIMELSNKLIQLIYIYMYVCMYVYGYVCVRVCVCVRIGMVMI